MVVIRLCMCSSPPSLKISFTPSILASTHGQEPRRLPLLFSDMSPECHTKLAERTYKTLMGEAKVNYESGKPTKGIAARLVEKELKGGDNSVKITAGGDEDGDGEPD
ncbi:hypothetical protein E1B28_012823 [Marasmius oreades]|uniref:Uncharacterized protein n=1 Tax=Marasmius oreades TaxID=181124 RepID=A0A9P7RSJ5_9AGAR|nr:uncharacterized protein E1B28_012823 [Marasmius oreades]KAG7088872.1 hypothetical protein E1B28_012823 [Marasmius oreades]